MRRSVLVLLGLVLMAGCGPKGDRGTVSGKITYNNQPVNGATLQLYKAGSNEPEMPIPVGQDGTFSTAGVPAGDYKVVVQANPGDPGPNTRGMKPEQIASMKESLEKLKTPPTIKFPDKYKSLDKTDLTLSIKPGSSESVDLVLKD